MENVSPPERKMFAFFHLIDGPFQRKVKTFIASYFMAVQTWSFCMSLAPVALGNVLAWRETSQFSLPIFILSTVIVLSVHAAGNAVYAYRDLCRFKKEDMKSATAMVHIGALCYVLACVAMLGVVSVSPAQIQHLALLFFGGLSASFLDAGIVKMH